MVNQRSIGLAIILSIITGGIYVIYWMCVLTNEVGDLSGEKSFTGGKAVLLTIVTCGIYSWFWAYQLGTNVAKAQTKKEVFVKDNSVLYLILGIFGLSIITCAIAQSDVNSLV
jgi:hypothetical protein